MLIKYFIETIIPFEDFKHSEIEQEVLKQMNDQYFVVKNIMTPIEVSYLQAKPSLKSHS